MSEPRICFFHIGTHKTGTTYLQTFLHCNEYALAKAGLYIPAAGRIGPSGHHNIAWSISGDVRYDPKAGGLDELVAELASVQPSRACVSSEDFEYLAHHPGPLRTTRARLNEIGYTAKAVVLLRPQADYAESLYAEFVRHGLTLDFSEFLDIFVKGGVYEGLTGDYSALLEPFAQALGVENVIVRRFQNSRKAEQIVFDFMSPMLPGFDLRDRKYRVNSFKENVTIPFSRVFQLYIGNNLEPPSSVAVDAVSLASSVRRDRHGYGYLSGPFDPVSLTDLLTKFWRMARFNLQVLTKYRVFIPFVSGVAFAKDVRTFLGFDLGSRRRRLLIDAFRRSSLQLRAVIDQLGGRYEKRNNAGSVDEKRLKSGVEERTQLRSDLESQDSRIQWLSQELVRRDSELLATKVQAARDIAARDREINNLEHELTRLQIRMGKSSSALVRAWGPLRFFIRQYGVAVAGRAAARRSLARWEVNRLARLISKSRLFDPEFYLAAHPELKNTGIDPVIHYAERGSLEGSDPHPLFDTSYYLEQNLDVLQSSTNALVHFIRVGARERRDPHPLFDTSYYLEQNPDVVRSGLNPLLHFIKYGGSEGRNPHPLFDIAYYTEQNPGVGGRGVNPLVHFLAQGRNARSPHPLFNCGFYLEENPEVATNDMNPLLHFVLDGALQGRNPHPLFDCSFYREQSASYEGKAFNPTVQFIASLNPLIHYLQYGVHEGRKPHPLFDTSFYLKSNPDVARAGVNPLIHFVQEGAFEGRDPSASFRMAEYLKNNPELDGRRVNPLIHFVLRRKNQPMHS